MRSTLFTLAGLAALMAVLVAAGHFIGRQVCVRHLADSLDDLQWLRLEFRLSDAEMGRIRELHEAYRPECQSFCDQIAAGNAELKSLLAVNFPDSAVVKQQLETLALLRARCQEAMLRHFRDVSEVMPPAQGARYLAEMTRLTLTGHDRIEETMVEGRGVRHGPH